MEGRKMFYKKIFTLFFLSIIWLQFETVGYENVGCVAIIADPHIGASKDIHADDNALRLLTAVDFVNQNRKREGIKYVFVIGDLGTEGRQSIENAKSMLDELLVPYIPIPGDNESVMGSLPDFCDVFRGHFQKLLQSGIGFTTASTTDLTQPTYFFNFALQYRGMQFVLCDWITRANVEYATCHQVSFDWLQYRLNNPNNTYNGVTYNENTMILSHHPLWNCNIPYIKDYFNDYVFSQADINKILNLIKVKGSLVGLTFAGHGHVSAWGYYNGYGHWYQMGQSLKHVVEFGYDEISMVSDNPEFCSVKYNPLPTITMVQLGEDPAKKEYSRTTSGLQTAAYYGVKGHWNFDENDGSDAADQSVWQNHGELSGATRQNGMFKRCVSFDGTDDFITIGKRVTSGYTAEMLKSQADAYQLGRGRYAPLTGGCIENITVAGWIRTTDDVGPIVDYNAAAFWSLMIQGVNSSPGRITWTVMGNVRGNNNGQQNILVSNKQINDGRWHHVAATYSATNGTQKIYIDGQLDASMKAFNDGVWLGTINATSCGTIGTNYLKSSYFAGKLDELIIEPRCLSEEELKLLARPKFDIRPIINLLLD
jgi:hypothetical protein